MNCYNSKFLISYTFTIRREVSPLRSRQGKERENFVFLPLMSNGSGHNERSELMAECRTAGLRF